MCTGTRTLASQIVTAQCSPLGAERGLRSESAGAGIKHLVA